MNTLDTLIIAHAKEAVGIGTGDDELRRDLEATAEYLNTCHRTSGGVRCERHAGHQGNCAAVIIF
jgi:hypothetical protein